MDLEISRKLFTVGIKASLITLNREANLPYYRASATRAIQLSAIYLKYRFRICDNPRWMFAYGMIGFFPHGSL